MGFELWKMLVGLLHVQRSVHPHTVQVNGTRMLVGDKN